VDDRRARGLLLPAHLLGKSTEIPQVGRVSMSEEKGPCSRFLHWYLNDRVSLAFSSAFTCGLVAFLFGTMATSLFAERAVAVTVGGLLAVLAGLWAARDQLRAQPKPQTKSCCSDAQMMRWFGLFGGSGMIACCAGQVLGLSGNLLLFLALITGAFISTMFAFVLDRR
jgi:hypothetical protein